MMHLDAGMESPCVILWDCSGWIALSRIDVSLKRPFQSSRDMASLASSST